MTWITFVRVQPSHLDWGFSRIFKALLDWNWRVHFLFVKVLHLNLSCFLYFLAWKDSPINIVHILRFPFWVYSWQLWNRPGTVCIGRVQLTS